MLFVFPIDPISPKYPIGAAPDPCYTSTSTRARLLLHSPIAGRWRRAALWLEVSLTWSQPDRESACRTSLGFRTA